MSTPNSKDYGFWAILRRWWREVTCTHWNSIMQWNEEGWNLAVCSRCHRALIYTNSQKDTAFDGF